MNDELKKKKKENKNSYYRIQIKYLHCATLIIINLLFLEKQGSLFFFFFVSFPDMNFYIPFLRNRKQRFLNDQILVPNAFMVFLYRKGFLGQSLHIKGNGMFQ